MRPIRTLGRWARRWPRHSGRSNSSSTWITWHPRPPTASTSRSTPTCCSSRRKFFNGKDPDEAKVKKLIGGIAGIYIKSFEFKNDGGYLPADLEKVRSQLKAPEWSRIVGVKSSGDSENIEIWVRNENGKVSGVAILASEPRQLTVVNLVGNVDLDSLADLGGHFGIPKMKKK